MNVLIACEESQVVCTAFRNKGHNAFSCDLKNCSGAHPEWHICGNVLEYLNPSFFESDLSYGIGFVTQDCAPHFITGKWDLIIAHPPCTFLTVTGNRWFDTGKYGSSAWRRMNERNKSIMFFYRFVMADCDRIAIENPVSVMSSAYRKPDQVIQPFMFGDPFEKKTCLWLKGLPHLQPTNVVSPPPRKHFASGKTMPAWYADVFSLPSDLRSQVRSRTFSGIAFAMASQWG